MLLAKYISPFISHRPFFAVYCLSLIRKPSILAQHFDGIFCILNQDSNYTNFSLMVNNPEFNVIVIGGSYAGLSAALALGRSLRNVLVIDSESPCNKQTPHSHNFITQDGEKPGVIYKKAKEQVLNYNTVKFHSGLAVSSKKTEYGFEVSTLQGEAFRAQKLIFATGLKDLFPDIKGFAECWGISVVHCPYCHGYEIRHQKTGIMANGEKAFHLASLVNNLTDHVTILSFGKADFDKEQWSKLKKHNINVIEKEITEIENQNGYVENVVFKDGSRADFRAVYAAIPFQQSSQIPTDLGCRLNEHGYIQVDEFQKTTIDGIYACGDNSSGMRSVACAVAAGNIAGARVNMELTNELF